MQRSRRTRVGSRRSRASKRTGPLRSENSSRSPSDYCLAVGAVEVPIASASSGSGLIGLPSLTTGANIYALSPASLLGRTAVFDTLFLRYRFKRLKLQYIPSVSTTLNGEFAFAISDDTLAATDSLTDFIQTVQLRTVQECTVYQRSPPLIWTPIDKSMWFYTSLDAIGDPRFEFQCALVANAASGNFNTFFGSLIIHYQVEFRGAVPQSTTLSPPIRAASVERQSGCADDDPLLRRDTETKAQPSSKVVRVPKRV